MKRRRFVDVICKAAKLLTAAGLGASAVLAWIYGLTALLAQ